MRISYGLTVCNEHVEINNLIEYLLPIIGDQDEIVIVYDQNRITDEVHEVLDKYKENVSSFPFDFQQNFIENKNYLGSECKGDYIFQIDADEIPNKFLVKNLRSILESNPMDMFLVSRINLVKGLTQDHINKWRWNVNEKGWVNFPDAQKRIYKNHPDIQWGGDTVHGMVQGYKTYAALPFEENFSIYHNKDIERQEKQNDRYNRVQRGELKALQDLK